MPGREVHVGEHVDLRLVHRHWRATGPWGGAGRRRRATGPERRAETFWTGFLRKLVRLGLKGVEAAVARVLGATWRRCRVHFMRNALF